MNEQKGVFKNLYKNLMTPILKNDSGIDAEYLTNLSLSLLSFSSRKRNWPLVSSILKNLNEEFTIIGRDFIYSIILFVTAMAFNIFHYKTINS